MMLYASLCIGLLIGMSTIGIALCLLSFETVDTTKYDSMGE